MLDRSLSNQGDQNYWILRDVRKLDQLRLYDKYLWKVLSKLGKIIGIVDMISLTKPPKTMHYNDTYVIVFA